MFTNISVCQSDRKLSSTCIQFAKRTKSFIHKLFYVNEYCEYGCE